MAEDEDEELETPKLCPKCGGEIPTKKNKNPAVPCTCEGDEDNLDLL